MNIDTTKIIKSFGNIKNFAYFNFLKCHRNLFTKKGIFKNIGCLIIAIIIIFHSITPLIFYLKQLDIITKTIKDIIFGIKNISLIKKTKKGSIK